MSRIHGLVRDSPNAFCDSEAQLTGSGLIASPMGLATFLGDQVDPSVAIDTKTELVVELPDGVEGSATLTIIEWKLEEVERRLSLRSAEGSIVDELQPGIQAPGRDWGDSQRSSPSPIALGHSSVAVIETPAPCPDGELATGCRCDEVTTWRVWTSLALDRGPVGQPDGRLEAKGGVGCTAEVDESLVP